MGRFKVGDLVRVSAPKEGWCCRPESFEGETGVIGTWATEDGGESGGVRLDNGQTWAFYGSELEMLTEMTDDRILTESGHWVHVKRPTDAPKASMFGGGEIIPDLGPTLRDQFAMAALTGMAKEAEYTGGGIKRACWVAYQFADDMLTERERAK